MLTPSVRSTTEVDLNRPMQEGLVITPFDYEALPPPASSSQGGTFLVDVSFLVLLRGGDDAPVTLDFLPSSNTLLMLFCFDSVSKYRA
ncbi:unnamed protein product [Sphagnum troendelagicum]|uniref:Uncharacterized protein n=1 Tax=Sphagnum troendelagicum TaxID=128251 RepID=A0ABP0UA15_9BRYO